MLPLPEGPAVEGAGDVEHGVAVDEPPVPDGDGSLALGNYPAVKVGYPLSVCHVPSDTERFESHAGVALSKFGSLLLQKIDRNFSQALKSLSHRLVGELTNTGVGAMGLKRGRPVQFHRPLVGP